MRAGLIGFLGVLMTTVTARAELVVNLRYDDGTTFKDVAGMQVGDTLTINVFATITGQPGNPAPEGLILIYYSILSRELTLGQFNGGGISARAMQPPFNAPAHNEGLINDANGDGVNDLGTLPGPPNANQPEATAGMLVLGPTSGFGQAVPDGWEFSVQEVIYTLGANDILRTGKRTDLDPVVT
ncbi:MAG: hypothetical protein ACREJC_13470, partial [Tepidisphaeraceae bacterium]